MQGSSLTVCLDEQIVFNQMDTNENVIWSLMLASGYLKVIAHVPDARTRYEKYDYQGIAVCDIARWLSEEA